MTDKSKRMPHGSEIEDLLIGQMQRDLARPKWWRTLRGRIVITVGALSIVSTAVAAVTLLESRPVTDTAIVHCLESASRNADGSLSGAAVSVAAPAGVVPITDAVSVCKQMWAAGGFDADDPLNPTPTHGAVPDDFTTCVTPDGSAAVVPGRIECSVLKLHPYESNSSTR